MRRRTIKTVFVVGSLILLSLPFATGAQQVHMPTLLIGPWNDMMTVPKSEECGPISLARGITVTSDGEIISNVGDRFCTLKELQVVLYPQGDTLGAWSYSGECVIRNTQEARIVPMFGGMRLAISDRPDKRVILSREEAQLPLPSTIWETRPQMDVETQYTKCR